MIQVPCYYYFDDGMSYDYSSPYYSAQAKEVHKKKTPQSARDYERIQRRIKVNGDKVDEVSTYIDNYFGTHVTIAILTSLAKIVMGKHRVKLDRLARRNRAALLCWYAENWDIVSDILKESNFKSMIRPLSGGIQTHSNSSVRMYHASSCDTEESDEAVDPMDISVLLNYH
ncbi:hypothetical protein TVAG_094930 [Trichomonas vaginalis G3]|uniref:Uncharacterized protein n=1 Tax=Trichomonas vaginalis (strain ATCC PRA-98 / G3) TaxID=412133 RepID=A2FZD6_TRIV3|nr:hypothetical protein TVAGG3_0724110 [Trichomonas vaginalis G3]EAX89728.1 hypothetical protein TVAG_094930 [Trichomonas vaginalis G3]KAI5510788.1 hypothetical protein TVAGG3_0724110 [Trichomonas vaginalis G3]|eukprot:XP_001302658.1 hypothetical protein [Trichomonas vaginalis G3]